MDWTQISPSLLSWNDETVGSTLIWYDEKAKRMCSDCGVSVPVEEPVDIAKILIDIEDEVIRHYKEQGIILHHSFR